LQHPDDTDHLPKRCGNKQQVTNLPYDLDHFENIFALDSPFCKRLVHADDPDYLAILQKNVLFNRLSLQYPVDTDHLPKRCGNKQQPTDLPLFMIWTLCKNIFALDSPFCRRPVHPDDPGYLANLQKNVLFDRLSLQHTDHRSLVKKLSINNNKLVILYDLDHLQKKLSHLTLLFARSRYIRIIWLICKKKYSIMPTLFAISR